MVKPARLVIEGYTPIEVMATSNKEGKNLSLQMDLKMGQGQDSNVACIRDDQF